MSMVIKRIVLTIMASTLMLSGCNSPIDDVPTTGDITGFARFAGAANNGGIIVSAESVDSSGTTLSARSLAGQATTDANGAYTLSGLTEGTYTLYASSQSSLEKAVSIGVTVTAGQSVAAGDLILTPTGQIQGTAHLDGTPGLGITVSVAGTSFSALTDSNGSFTISSVPAAAGYTLVASMPGYDSVIQLVDVAVGETTTPPTNPMNLTTTVIPPTTGTISGTAQRGGSASGNAGIFVYLLGTAYMTMTADSGAFSIDGVAPGTYTVTAAAMGCLPTSIASVMVTAGSNTDAGILSLVYRDYLGTVFTLAGLAGSSGSTDGTGTAALFNSPCGVATDGTNLYVADTNNYTIRKVVISTGVVSTLAGLAGSSGSTNGTGTAARFSSPCGVAIDGNDLYVADFGNNSIRKIVISTGVVSTLAGATTPGSTDGTGTAARFRQPYGIATDGINLYVADTNNNTIRKVVISTAVVSTLAGSAGPPGSTDGTGTGARFNQPRGVATDGTNIYIADMMNHTIRKVVISTGVVTTLAGSAGSSGSANGTGSAARFSSPYGVASDGTNLYVADQGGCTIRKVVILTAAVSTLSGLAGSSGSTDGTSTTALFNGPCGVATDGINLYVADTNNNTIREIR